MNNKGFTLIELLLTISIISIITISVVIIVNDTFSLTEERAYEILKKSIVTQVNEYILECDNNLINCKNDYTWKNIDNVNKTSFKLNVMKKYSYFKEEDFINPVTNEDIGNCLIINVTKDEFSKIGIFLEDNNCKK